MNAPLRAPSPRLQPRPLQSGTHLARCSAILDLGTHDEPGFSKSPGPPVSKSQRKLLLTFTLFAQDGSTQRLSRQFTHSCDVRSSLSKFLTPWLGTAWHQQPPQTTANNSKPRPTLRVSAIAEYPCLLVLQASEAINARTGLPYLNITAASPLIAGLEVPDLKWPAAIFSLKAPNRDTFQHLPAWIQSKIRTSHEWLAMKKSSSSSSSIPAQRAHA